MSELNNLNCETVAVHCELHPEHGVMQTIHFTKMPDKRLQISLCAPVRNSPTAIYLEPETVHELIKELVAAYMLPAMEMVQGLEAQKVTNGRVD